MKGSSEDYYWPVTEVVRLDVGKGNREVGLRPLMMCRSGTVRGSRRRVGRDGMENGPPSLVEMK